MRQEATDGPARPYHHGDLRAALLAAAAAELEARGIEAFSLRSVAKRAGVSHAAPAHHFGDVNGLLTALAAEGFRRFVAHQAAREDRGGADPAARLVEAGLGYIAFARANPALFRLMFASDRPDFGEPALAAAAEAAFGQLADACAAVAVRRGGAVPPAEVEATWGIVHGLADLLAGGRLKRLAALPEAEREAELRDIIARGLPR
ncbi:MAG: TetR/AcrR family transcriptional regulator [Rhodobacteraceae bacterium]|nr:TetR/AcrR family transcriptional regulator [Paracoccaceae bacterium]